MLENRSFEMELPAAYNQLRNALERAENPEAAAIAEQRRLWVHQAIQNKDFNDLRWLSSRGRTTDALARIQQAHERMPNNPHIALILARLLRFERHYAQSHAALFGLLELDSCYPGAQVELSHALDCLGRFDEAIEAARTAVMQDPADLIAATRLAELENRIVDGGVLMNVAIGKVATQSSYSQWSHEDDPVRAINGSRTGGYAFCTDVENEPWWELDLGSAHEVRRIVIYNRDDDAAGRAKTLEIRAREDTEQPWQTLHLQNGIFGGVHTGTPLTLNFSPPATLRHLRILLHEPTLLHLNQVEVYSLIADRGIADVPHR